MHPSRAPTRYFLKLQRWLDPHDSRADIGAVRPSARHVSVRNAELAHMLQRLAAPWCAP